MTVDELIQGLMHRDLSPTDPAVVIAEDGTTYTIKEVVEEQHELGTTVWLKVEEN